MLCILSSEFLTKRDTLRKSILDLIQRTTNKVAEEPHPGFEFDGEITVTINDSNFKWDKYNQKHKVAILFVEKPILNWYFSEEAKMYIIECFSPSKVITWAEGYPEFFYAFEKAMNFNYYLDLSERIKHIEYHVVTDIPTDPIFKHVYENGTELGCDIETRGFDWRNQDITVHGFCYEEGKVIIIPQPVVDKNIDSFLMFKQFSEDENKKFIWQNGKFDTKFNRHQNVFGRVDEDTQLMSYALDEREKGIHGLEYQATKILNTPSYKHQIDFETVDIYDKKLHYYLAQDCCNTFLIYKHHKMMFQKKSNEHSYKLYKNILLRANWALLRLEENGFYVNQEYTKQLEKDYSDELSKLKSDLVAHATKLGFTPLNFQLWSKQKKLPDKLSLSAPKQLAYIILKLLDLPKYKGEITTNAKAIMYWLFDILEFPNTDPTSYLDTPEERVNEWFEKSTTQLEKDQKLFLWGLIQYRKKFKMYSTYILNALQYSQQDGRIHVTFKIHGTVTGRLSSGDPMNLQNIPRQAKIKNIFKAPEGKTLIECDYSQAELRVLAYLSQDPDMIKTYADDGDLHNTVAIKMFGKNFTKEQRVGAKTINFGLAYGRGASSVAEQLRCSYKEADMLINQWHESMPVASNYIRETRKKPKQGVKCISPTGRERRFWLINHKNENGTENESINFPIQSTASDFALIALVHFIEEIEKDPIKWKGVMPVNIVHDAILIEAPDELVDDAVELLSNCMVRVPKELIEDFNIAMKADAEVSKIGWGKKTSYEKGIAFKL